MKTVSRRQAMTALSAAGAGTCLCSLNAGCATFSKKGNAPEITKEAYVIENKRLQVMLDQVPSLSSIGGSAKILDPRLPSPLIIGRTAESTYAVVSLLCPHRGVEVEYRHSEEQFRCASLGHSKFKTDGTLKKGLSKSGLSHYQAQLNPADKNCLWVLLDG